MAILLITHDLGVVAEMADYVVVMYAGKVVEEGEVVALFENPQHPYTQGLLKSKPIINQRQDELYSIPGQVPNPLELAPSCYFHDRCAHCMDICRTTEPALKRGPANARRLLAGCTRRRSRMAELNQPLLEVNGLKKYFPIKSGLLGRTVGSVKAVDDISFTIKRGETFGLVGESGSGKSTVGRTILRLTDKTDGEVKFNGVDLYELPPQELRGCGRRCSSSSRIRTARSIRACASATRSARRCSTTASHRTRRFATGSWKC